MSSGGSPQSSSPHPNPRQRRASLSSHLEDKMSATFTELEFRSDDHTLDTSKSSVGVLGCQARPHSEPEPTPSTLVSATQADHTISPFLKTHIPHQYNPLGPSQEPHKASGDKSTSTRYCYRHRPDLKCRRQANEPSMEQLQKELGELPPSDQQGISHVWSLFSAAPSRHRNLMLQGILAQCCFPQLSYISASVRDLIKIDFLSVLPSELGLNILCFLDPTSICKAAQVSRRWRSLADDDVVWHRMCEQHIDRKCTKCGWGLPLLDRKRLRIEKRQIQLRASGQHDLDHIPRVAALAHEVEEHARHARTHETKGLAVDVAKKRAVDMTFDDSHDPKDTKKRCTPADSHANSSRKQAWKDVYRDRFKIGNNWKKDRYRYRTFKGHTNGVMAVQFDDNIIASGSYDSTIKIWDIASGKEIRTLTGHSMPIRCLQFDESKLISGSLDNTIKIWNLQTGELLRTLNGHTGGVISLHFDGPLVASGSKDHTIRIWNFKDMSVSTLHGHQEWVNCVKLDTASRTLLSASDDCTIRLWDLDGKRCLREFGGHVAQVQQVVAMPRGFEPENVDTEDIEATWTWPDDDSARPAPPRYILSGALSGNIRMWDIFTGRCIRTFFGHIEGVWGLAADSLRVVSGANDGMIKVWDPRTGSCERTYTNHAGPVTCVGLSDRRMCSGSEDHEVSLFDFCE